MVFFLKNIKKTLLLSKISFRNPYFYIATSIFILGIISIADSKNHNLNLYFKPIIIFAIWAIAGNLISTLLLRCKNQGCITDFLCKISISLSLSTLLFCLLEYGGPALQFPIWSSTYGLYGFREWGAFLRPSGLTREPAHLIVMLMFCLLCLKEARPTVRFVVVVSWICIASITVSRSLFLGLALGFLLALLTDSRGRTRLVHVALLLSSLLIGYVINQERINTIFIFASDESTMTRYGLVLGLIDSFIQSPLEIKFFESIFVDYCDNGDVLDVSVFACLTYPKMVLNFTIYFITALPIIVSIPALIALLTMCGRDLVGISFFMFCGLFFYIWAFPGLGVFFLHSDLLRARRENTQ